jgi:hypothetical protein
VDALLAAVLSESEPDGTAAPGEAGLRDGVAEYVDAAPQRLAELQLLRVEG